MYDSLIFVSDHRPGTNDDDRDDRAYRDKAKNKYWKVIIIIIIIIIMTILNNVIFMWVLIFNG